MQINKHRLPGVLDSQNEGQGEPIKATTAAQQLLSGQQQRGSLEHNRSI